MSDKVSGYCPAGDFRTFRTHVEVMSDKVSGSERADKNYIFVSIPDTSDSV